MTQQHPRSTILVVEDDAATSEFYVDLLSLYGYQTRVAASGREALAEFQRSGVDLVLLDRRLPDMNGLDVCRKMRASRERSVPIILLSADNNPELADAAREAGTTDYFTKPFEPDKLIDRIADLLHE